MEEPASLLPISLNIWGHNPIDMKYCIRQSEKKQDLERKCFKNSPNVLLNHAVSFHL